MRLDKGKVASVVGTEFGQRMLEESDRAQAGNPEKDQIWTLLVDEIDPDPDQPRRHFDEGALQDLAADIARRGVLQPILVQRSGGDRYRIIVGERRWRASKMAGKPRIPCIIKEMDASEVRQAQLVENVIRQGISDIERGLALRQLYDTRKAADRKATWETIAQTVGLTRMRINHLYNLSLLPPAIVDMIQAGRLSGSHGVELARLNGQPEQQEALARQACRSGVGTTAYGMSVAQLRERISEALGSDTARSRIPRAPAPLSPQQIAERGQDLTKALRPDLPPDVRQRLRETAEHILRFLDQEPESVKSTLQRRKQKISEDEGRSH